MVHQLRLAILESLNGSHCSEKLACCRIRKGLKGSSSSFGLEFCERTTRDTVEHLRVTDVTDLPLALREAFLKLVLNSNGDVEVTDKSAFLDFVAKHGPTYPFLKELIMLDEDAVSRHVQETGEVPAGIKAIRRTEIEGSNVVELEVIHGPKKISS
jgi:hypothetical protein